MHPREMQTLRDVTYPSMGVLGVLVANTSLHYHYMVILRWQVEYCWVFLLTMSCALLDLSLAPDFFIPVTG